MNERDYLIILYDYYGDLSSVDISSIHVISNENRLNSLNVIGENIKFDKKINNIKNIAIDKGFIVVEFSLTNMCNMLIF